MAIGSDIVAKAMKHEGVTDFFYIMGAPMLGVEKACMTLGLRGIDVRHEQAAAMAGFAYSRLLNRPSFCMAASGPGVTNLLTGIAHAWADCTPVIALGGAAPVTTWHRGAFQDIDQLAIFKPCTKWSDRVHHVRRIPELIHLAVTQAMTGKPGPVYLDMPGDVLYQEVDESKIEYPAPYDHAKRPRPMPSAGEVRGDRRSHGQGRATRADHRNGRALVRGRCRDAGVRRGGGHSVLHDAARPRRHPRGPRAFLSHRAGGGVSGRGSDRRGRHAHELRDRACGPAALECRSKDRAHRHRSIRDRELAAPPRHRRGRRREGSLPAADECHQGQGDAGPLRDVARAPAHPQRAEDGGGRAAALHAPVADSPAEAVQGDP